MENRRLQLKFENEDSKAFSISLQDFKSGLTADNVKDAAGKNLSSTILEYKGKPAKSLVGANVITIETSKLV